MNKKHIVEMLIEGKLIKVKLPSQTKAERDSKHLEYMKKRYQKIRTSNLTPELRKKKKIIRKIGMRVRNRLKMALKRNSKKGGTLELLGCSIEFLKGYLELQFKTGMTWENYGGGYNGKGMKEWHIDHIRPCSSFDLNNTNEQRKCFHYTNLQPLWAKENWDKHHKESNDI